MPFYAIYTGHIQSGVYETWEECKREIKTPKYKKFDTLEEAKHFQTYGPFATSEIFDMCVYTDGSCKHNGKDNAVGGIGIYFGENDSRNVSKQIHADKMTNNIAELTAIMECLSLVPKDVKVGIYTDSQYAILCCTTYGDKCAKKKWKDVPNGDLVKKVYELYKLSTCTLVHVNAHTLKCDVHSNGNREADRLANVV